ncbi:MAG: FecR domain-containing protein [Prolixibacteraceae bacterium]|nr:FecR domain-containing protein [Prolixibacteraceae bacterium]
MKETDHYETYSTDDFILDENFRKIVRTSESNNLLKELQENFPAKRNEMNMAIQVIRGMNSPKFRQTDLKKHEIWEQIVQKRRKQIRLTIFRYAASILLFIGIGSAAIYFTTQKPAPEIIVSNVLPAKNAVLILSDGKTIPITSKQSTVQYSANGKQIIVNDSSDITQNNLSIGFNQLIVPYGKRSFVVLSEGTKVWLNSGSKLIFPPVFTGSTREVVLEGEALFDVTKDAKKPFYVKTDAFKIKVYGTKFNVQAYQQDEDYNIVLIEGKVRLNSNNSMQSKEIFLAPNQKATISKGHEDFGIKNIENTEVYTAWVDGYLTFTNENLPVLLKRVSRYYNVEIETQLPDNIATIYGKLDLKDELERVLDGIAFISKTKYEKRGAKYVFINN